MKINAKKIKALKPYYERDEYQFFIWNKIGLNVS